MLLQEDLLMVSKSKRTVANPVCSFPDFQECIFRDECCQAF